MALSPTQIIRILSHWSDMNRLDLHPPFKVMVRSTVDVKPGAVLLLDTLEITDGAVVAVAYPQVEET